MWGAVASRILGAHRDDIYQHDKPAFWGTIAIVLLGILTDTLWKRSRDRKAATSPA
jgi:hypothetical protein